MKYIILSLLLVQGCASNKIMVKNCKHVAQVNGNDYFKCEEIE